jgi:hypothetical protein
MLPPSFADRFSLSSATGFLHYIFPQWIAAQQLRTTVVDRHNENFPNKSFSDEERPYPYPPFILPFTASAYSGERESIKAIKTFARETARREMRERAPELSSADIGRAMLLWNDQWDLDVNYNSSTCVIARHVSSFS